MEQQCREGLHLRIDREAVVAERYLVGREDALEDIEKAPQQVFRGLSESSQPLTRLSQTLDQRQVCLWREGDGVDGDAPLGKRGGELIEQRLARAGIPGRLIATGRVQVDPRRR